MTTEITTEQKLCFLLESVLLFEIVWALVFSFFNGEGDK
jgi:hypothetical protein